MIFRKVLPLILLGIFSVVAVVGISQGCLPEGITFSTQADLDDFPVSYPDCIEIEGPVVIMEDTLSPYPIKSLLPLGNLVSIAGDLMIIENSSLKNLSGLDNLKNIGGEFQVIGNDSLQNVQNLASLVFLGGGLHFQLNKSLADLYGLEGLTEINGDMVFMQHPVLQNMDAFQSIQSVAGDFSISWLCSMYTLTCFSGLKYIEGSMSVEHFCSVGDLDGFSSLNSIGGELHINDNDILDDITGIGNIDPMSISGLEIVGNKSLSECQVESVCEFIIQQTGAVEIAENLPGCNSMEEVNEACITSAEDIGYEMNTLTLYPNPASGTVTIRCNVPGAIGKIELYDAVGSKVLEASGGSGIADVSGLNPGIYSIRIHLPAKLLQDILIVQ